MTHLCLGLIIAAALLTFFAGMAAAFASSNRLLVEMEKERNSLSQRAITYFFNHHHAFAATMHVGICASAVCFALLLAQAVDTWLLATLTDSGRIVADIAITTIAVLLFGELIPKSIFKNNPNTTLTLFAVPAMACHFALYPVTLLATFTAKTLLRLFGIRTEKTAESGEFTKGDLDSLVQRSIDNACDDHEIGDEMKIFQNALDFTDTKVRDCMVPRTEIDGVDIDDCDLERLKNSFIESGYSKLIVYKGDIDHIVGYIHSSEMFRTRGEEWKDNVRSMPFVPETMAANTLLQTLLQQKKTLAAVVDEFGGTSGIVSLEDIVEEIFGEIEDEHDSNSYIAKQTNKNEYVLSARLEISKVNEMFSLDLPESDEYMTVGGLILNEYKSFPKLNDVVKTGKHEFRIIKNTATKIELVKLKVSE